MRTASTERGDGSWGPPHPPDWVFDVVAVVVVITSALFVPMPPEGFRPAEPVAIAAAVAAALILPVRRRWPLAVLAACLVLFGLASSTGSIAPGNGIAVAIAVFAVTTRTARRPRVIATAVAIVVVLGFSVASSLGSVFDPRVFQFALVVAFAAAAGDGSRSRRDYIAAITERAERAERTREAEAERRVTEERLRIARDLHDAVAHQIAVISLNAGVASSVIDSNPDKAKDALSIIRGAARSVLSEIGDLMNMLRAGDDAAETEAAPQPSLARLDEVVEQFTRAGLEVQVRVEGDPAGVSGAIGLVAYRVVQEGLTNAHKHGAGRRAHVLVTRGDDSLTVVVTNPMQVTPAKQAGAADGRLGMGLLGLRERVTSVRGTIEVGPSPGGWRLAAVLPLPKEELG